MFPLTSHPHLVHALFEAAAISAGAWYYRREQRRAGIVARQLLEGGRFAVLLGCLFGAAIGNKLVFWIEMPQLLPLYWNSPAMWFAGQSMVGGLLGGLLGVELAKRVYGVRQSTGDAFVFPVLLGLMIGRVGCFVAGLDDGTFGLPTQLPLGVDFGDGVSRHPTQLYEIAFAGGLWGFLRRLEARRPLPSGVAFRLMLCGYLLWRLFVDGLKPVPFDYVLGLSGIQVVCGAALLVYLPLSVAHWRREGASA